MPSKFPLFLERNVGRIDAYEVRNRHVEPMGETTTTSLLASCLYDAKLDPTVVIGGKLNMLDSSTRLGEGEYMVAEADESDGSFLLLNPTISVITNIDPEHLEYWKTEEKFDSGFEFCPKFRFLDLLSYVWIIPLFNQSSPNPS